MIGLLLILKLAKTVQLLQKTQAKRAWDSFVSGYLSELKNVYFLSPKSRV
jgi:hypothetical protein